MRINIAVLLGVVLVSGCGQKKPDPLEARIVALETKAEKQREFILSFKTNISEFMTLTEIQNESTTSNLNALRGLLVVEYEDLEKLKKTIGESADQSPKPIARPVTPARPESLKHGIPASVYDGIAADAAKRFPGDYEEQVYIINNQVESYLKLHGR
jgi:hypothetical protein